ncbi:patatin-like phospholipase family protein [Ferrimonas marina]|uniref:Patatin-like phospholipase n=1 Tax=Ferrimonas marina TaxID=299255 RepID=A0A1M5NFL4_9GAMM|nr:patatin-like phospholipase family protein [Ferrimonas marina]SHG88262.1 Patatin-like phospholipase [Ferrimonas marina]
MVRWLSLALVWILVGCNAVSRTPLPPQYQTEAQVLGRDDLRHWADQLEQDNWEQLMAKAEAEQRLEGIRNQSHNYLILSGGGDNGAYGAGLLLGWSARGDRPRFTMVTGISTGALIAPFAFLGEAYNPALKELYTTMGSDDIFRQKGLFSMLGSDALADSTPLAALIESYLDDEMIQALAEAYYQGRTLLIGTTNLDAARPVMWNITRIAATEHPQAPQLIRQLFLASASLPGLFPPVYVPVTAGDDQRFDEMHVDGGATAQLFFYPSQVDWRALERRLGVVGQPQLFLIRNAHLSPSYKPVDPKIGAIAGKTIDSLIRTQGIGDLYRIAYLAQRDGLGVHASWIPDGVGSEVEKDEVFDPDYMRVLFDEGFDRAKRGEAWHDLPPQQVKTGSGG